MSQFIVDSLGILGASRGTTTKPVRIRTNFSSNMASLQKESTNKKWTPDSRQTINGRNVWFNPGRCFEFKKDRKKFK